MFTQLNNVPTSILCIEIGGHLIKLLEVSPVDGTYRVENYSITSIPAHAAGNLTEIKNPALLSGLIENTFAQFNTQTRQALTVVPGSAVILKQFSVNKQLKPSDVEAQAWTEAKKLFPDLIDELSLDFSIIGQNPTSEELTDVLLVVCRKEFIDVRASILEEAGLKPRLVDVDYYALERVLRNLCNKENSETHPTSALLHLTTHNSTLAVLEKNHLLYAQDQILHGFYLLEEGRTILGVENLYNPLPELTPEKSEAIKALLTENFLPHLRHFLQFFYSAHSQTEIQKLYISGEIALMPHLCDIMKGAIDVPCEIANPFKGLQLAPTINTKAFEHIAPAMVVCYGLALGFGAL